MAIPIVFDGANKRVGRPLGSTHPGDLVTYNNGICSVSCWVLTPDELTAMLESGGRIFVSVLSGRTQPALFVGGEESVRGVVAERGGAWAKGAE